MMKNCFLTFILRSGLHRNENPLNPNLIHDLVNNFKRLFKNSSPCINILVHPQEFQWIHDELPSTFSELLQRFNQKPIDWKTIDH